MSLSYLEVGRVSWVVLKLSYLLPGLLVQECQASKQRDMCDLLQKCLARARPQGVWLLMQPQMTESEREWMNGFARCKQKCGSRKSVTHSDVLACLVAS